MEESFEKKSRTKWTNDEETVLISSVLDREAVLFGDFKGTGALPGQARRRQGWEEKAELLNA